MKRINRMLDEYSESHQNSTNQLVHKFCVPAIVFSVIGFIMLIPSPAFFGVINWAIIGIVLALGYYLKLSVKYGLLMLPVLILIYYGNLVLLNMNLLLQASIVIFIISWAIQFWGHKIEGKKPSFLKDIFFLLVGPLWVLKSIFKLKD